MWLRNSTNLQILYSHCIFVNLSGVLRKYQWMRTTLNSQSNSAKLAKKQGILNFDSWIHVTEGNMFFDYLSYFTGRRSVNIYHVTGVYSVSKYLSIDVLFNWRQLVISIENQDAFLPIYEYKFWFHNHT